MIYLSLDTIHNAHVGSPGSPKGCRIPAAILAQRASISRTTLVKVEKGDRGVSLGTYAKVLYVLGMIHRLEDLADPRHDSVGLAIDEEHLPKRIRLPRAIAP